MYYGLAHRYGGIAIDSDGDPIGTYMAFQSRAKRDEWVNDGEPYFTQPGAREAVSANDKHLRRHIRNLIRSGCPDWQAYLLDGIT